MSLKHKVLSGLMAAALSASLLACSSAPAPAASSAPASSLPSVSQQTETPSYAYHRSPLIGIAGRRSLSADGDAQLCLSAGNGAEHTLWHSGRIF